ncbi:hypothetical protein QBC46DRAFT_459929 [Diplogelasinospora grovesii]|uniref:Peptidase metallopeptidase domain-containing protein n=1 Tax=Diplogelasinospora grovesii TaxID=303347 RepID=A0AAN6N4D1_9PEZI|nr:hypothetical protein QBC46DRAFT_459929 [Diplogelasinospora grovesii]
MLVWSELKKGTLVWLSHRVGRTDSDEDGDDDSIILSDDEEGGDMAAVSISDADSDGEPLHMAVKKSNRWKPGQELRIRFIGGHSSIRDKVKKYARVWERYAYIKFKFSQNEPSQIRISFRRNGGSWSKVGKDALNTDSTKPTMNLKISAATSEARIRRTVLHEFGHALGCVHEHSSPSATGKIKWNRQAVYDDHQGIWTREQVDHNIFKTYKGTITQFSRFDQKSIMLYPIPSSWTMDGWHSNLNTTLSDTDKSFIAKLYPKPKRRRHSRRGSQGQGRHTLIGL